MKFLADESVEYRVILFLRKQNFDTVSISEESPSLEDMKVLSRAFREDRILITNDKDFGELIHRLELPHKGVIFFRLTDETAGSKIVKMKELMSVYGNRLQGSFTVVTRTKIRLKIK